MSNKATHGWVDDENMSLLVDLYELTMTYSYFKAGMNGPATFDLFVRELPPNRSFMVSAGLEQLLLYLENVGFDKESIEYLRGLGLFDEDFLDFLGNFRFTGEVYAMSEGEIFFPLEPAVVVSAPLIEAQIVETFLLNCFNFQTLIASKAARIVKAAEGRPVVDFSARRDHGADSALKTARASYISGFVGTSNLLAGKAFDIPVYGTMAHSYVMSFASELEAFKRYARDFPDSSVLLVDTYDVRRGLENAVTVAKEMEKVGKRLDAVRIDSGDIDELSKFVRNKLDGSGLSYVKIMVSGDMNEHLISDLLAAGCPIDIFAVGTELGTSKDAPSLGGVYKLSEDSTGPKMKLSEKKATLPGKKTVVRFFNHAGCMSYDVIVAKDGLQGDIRGANLLTKYMEGGKIAKEMPDIMQIRDIARRNISSIPDELKKIDGSEKEKPSYLVEVDDLIKKKMLQGTDT